MARYFVAVARANATSKPPLSVLLSLEALEASPIPAAQEALRHALAHIGGKPLVGHQGWVNSVAFSPDGKRIASANSDGTVRIWNPQALQDEPIVLTGHQGPVNSVAFSPDGNSVASASDDRTVRIWNPQTTRDEPIVLSGHQASVNSVVFSPDGKRFASASDDRTVRIWNPQAPQDEPIVLTGHQDSVSSVAFSPDGKRIASASGDFTVRIWNPQAPQDEPIIFTGHEHEVYSVAFSPDGKRIASASLDRTVHIWNPQAPQDEPIVLAGHQDSVYSVAFSPDGKRIASASGDFTVRIWNPQAPQDEPIIFTGHENEVHSVAFSPDGKRIASASLDRTVHIWNLQALQNEPIVLTGRQGWVNSVAFSPDGNSIASANSDHTVLIWNPDIDSLAKMACHFTGRNFTNEEWKDFLVDEPYRKTCLNLPLAPDFLQVIGEQIAKGQIKLEQALSRIQYALQPDDTSNAVASDEAKRLIAPSLLDIGESQARSGKIEHAIFLYKRALNLDPSIGNKPEYAVRWNSLCWFGALDGFATDVLDACIKAVDLAPDKGNIRDSRGVARALTGDYIGAIEDFTFFIQWARGTGTRPAEHIIQRKSWIQQLQTNRNPFTPELLQQLRER